MVDCAEKPEEPCMWVVDELHRFRRFLTFGSDSSTYTCEEVDVTKSNMDFVTSLLEGGCGLEAVEEVKKFSIEGRSARYQPVLYALALCAKRAKDTKVRQAAFEAVADICSIPTHLFFFIKFCEQVCESTGWGRAQRSAVCRWYDSKDPSLLALYVTKYRQRAGWSHKDLIRLSHLKPKSLATALLLKYVVKGLEATKGEFSTNDKTPPELKSLLEYLEVVETVKHSGDELQVAALVEKHKLVHEHIPTGLLKSKTVWKSLIPHMPMEALIRSLAKISSLGLLKSDEPENCIDIVLERLRNISALQAAKLHPATLLVAWMTYRNGEGDKGKKIKWEPNADVTAALEQAFHGSFKYLRPTGQRHLIAVDVSKSMQFGNVQGACHVSPEMAAAAMVMATVHVEENFELVGFSASGLAPIPVSRDMMVQEVCRAFSEIPMGSTDCALPMKWALEHKKAFDVFIVFTDCDSSSPVTHPADSLRIYRKLMDIPHARLAVCALCGTEFSQADPQDAGMLDITGFDSTAPQIIRNFAEGLL